MSDLIDAIEAESRGDFAAALPHYEKLTASGSPLDRVGIHQALARCNEKLGRLKDAGAWRRKAGQGYLALNDNEMARDERQYLALVEYRIAMEVLHGIPIFHEREVLPFVSGHLVVVQGEVSLPRLPTPRARVLEASQLLVAPGEGLMDPDAIERGTGGREFLVMGQGGRKVPARFGLDRIDQIGHREQTPRARDKGPSDLRPLAVAFPDPDVQGEFDSFVQPVLEEQIYLLDGRVLEERVPILVVVVREDGSQVLLEVGEVEEHAALVISFDEYVDLVGVPMEGTAPLVARQVMRAVDVLGDPELHRFRTKVRAAIKLGPDARSAS